MRLIDAECIWDHSICYDIECDKCSFADGEKCKLRQRIQNVRSVDVEPVRHGHWIIHVDELFAADSTQECSVCHGEEWLGIKHENYCPNCGAKMDEEVNT